MDDRIAWWDEYDTYDEYFAANWQEMDDYGKAGFTLEQAEALRQHGIPAYMALILDGLARELSALLLDEFKD